MRRRQGRRRWLREKELAEIWRRVAAGEPTREIAAAVDCSMRTVEEVVWRAGGTDGGMHTLRHDALCDRCAVRP